MLRNVNGPPDTQAPRQDKQHFSPGAPPMDSPASGRRTTTNADHDGRDAGTSSYPDNEAVWTPQVAGLLANAWVAEDLQHGGFKAVPTAVFALGPHCNT
jgi:hypothetical protein